MEVFYQLEKGCQFDEYTYIMYNLHLYVCMAIISPNAEPILMRFLAQYFSDLTEKRSGKLPDKRKNWGGKEKFFVYTRYNKLF